MGSLNNLIILNAVFFIFLCFSLKFILPVNSDDNLINTLCSKTDQPVFCRDCLHADPKSSSADGPGLALIALDCAEKDTTQLQDDVTKLVQNATGKLKKALDDCSSQSFMAQQDFDPLRRYVREGDYKGARNVLTGETIPDILACLKAFDEIPDVPVPPLIIAGTVASNQSSQNAAAILANI